MGIVAEEAEVTGPAARGDAGAHVAQQAARGPAGERVQGGDARGLQLALARPGPGQAAQAVERAQDDLGGGGLHERVQEL